MNRIEVKILGRHELYVEGLGVLIVSVHISIGSYRQNSKYFHKMHRYLRYILDLFIFEQQITKAKH